MNKQNSEEMQDEQLVFWEMCEKCYKMSDIQSQSWKLVSGSGCWLEGRRRSMCKGTEKWKRAFRQLTRGGGVMDIEAG